MSPSFIKIDSFNFGIKFFTLKIHPVLFFNLNNISPDKTWAAFKSGHRWNLISAKSGIFPGAP